MATFQELMRAAVNADNAGDAAAAKQLVQMAQPLRPSANQANMQNQPMPPAAKPSEKVPNGLVREALEEKARRQALSPADAAREEAARRKRRVEQASTVESQSPQEARWRDAPLVGGRESDGRERGWFRRTFLDDGDPASMNLGERVAAGLNIAGESMTMGLIGDEAAGAFDQLIGRGDYESRRDFYRDQEAQFRDSNPKTAIAADIGGALLGPGKGAGAIINKGLGTGARVARGAAVGGATGAIYGAAEGEGDAVDRISPTLQGATAGAVGGGVLTGVGQGFLRASQALSRSQSAKDAAPAVEGLKDAAQRLYQQVDESGVVVPQGQIRGLKAATQRIAQVAGYHPRLHPRVSVLLDEISNMQSGPTGLRDIQVLRRIAGNAAQSIQPDERRIAAKLIDNIDETVERVAGGEGMRGANKMWAKMRRFEAIENIIEDAANTPNFERTVQTKLRALLRNKRRTRGFSGDELRAITKIAKGDVTSRSLQALGKALSPNSLSGVALTGGAAYASGPGAIAIPAAGIGMQAAANAVTRGRIQDLRKTMGRTPQQDAIARAISERKNVLALGVPGGAVGVNALAE
ncbi:hypothetical protein [Marivita sp.]|uniref:hypothetical protein n=1 Tax=Marivita sp. TaxID=2003365 RepID=UPI003F718BDD